jgi:N6-adenosine-specific RNA methylase IME4
MAPVDRTPVIAREDERRYRTIVVDPPWRYTDGGGFVMGNRAKRWTTPLPYEWLSVEQIKSLPIAQLAEAAGCRLFLWTTNKYLRSAFDILDAWGFRYGQTITWHKTGCPSPFPTSIAPQHSDFLLFATKGKPGRWQRGRTFPSTVITAPAQSQSHSTKPDVFLDLIEAASDAPYIELFARRARFGWDYWGDQSLGTAELGALS